MLKDKNPPKDDSKDEVKKSDAKGNSADSGNKPESSGVSEDEKIPKEHFTDRRLVKAIFGGVFALIVFALLGIYWFMPFNSTQLFVKAPANSNFSLNSSQSMYNDMQFYPNMRYTSPNISYTINTTRCSLQKQNNMQEAFKRIENITFLHFYSVNSNPEISVSCDNKVVVNKSYFIAGEGGPVNITQAGKFNVIEQGEVLLLRDSNCQVPNIATHELLHALGFKHSKNPNNVMYPVTDCSQTIGQDIPSLINQLYSYPTLPDLEISNATATIKGRYINANVTIKNEGLQNAAGSTLIISSGNARIRTETVPAIPIGSGITFSFTNLLSPININQLEFNVLTNFSELEKNNNKIELDLKS